MSGDLQLLWDQWPWLQAKARWLAGDDGDDLAQETLAAAWRSWDRVDPARPIRPWLYTALRWRWMRTVQRVEAQNRRRHVSLDEPVGHDPDPDGDVRGDFIPAHDERATRDTEAYDILRALPPDQADLVEGLYMGGYSHDELASMHGVPRGTIASRMWTARQTILNPPPPREPNPCAFCDEPVAGHPNKRYCSDGCSQKAKYQRHRRQAAPCGVMQ